MAVPLPTTDQIREAAKEVGVSLTDEDVRSYRALIVPHINAYNLVDALPDDLPIIQYPRTSGHAPSVEENSHNAWYVKTSIKGASTGPLKGKRIAIKDNVMVAGVPMMNGSSILEGYIPDVDATVVTRLLDAGAEIIGKTHCESYCISGGSHTCAKGPVHNPHKKGYSAGGSSSGSAVVVALGEADMAIGGDQGGSIRMPSSWSGIYGMKPTYGLVPYTGIMPIEIFVDHTGPMTANVADNALMLEVIAGVDGYDSRQPGTAAKVKYSQRLDGGVKGMKIAMVKEGFARPESEAASDAKVKKAAEWLQKLGAQIDEVSIPCHLIAPAIWTPIGVEGITQTMMFGNGYGLSRSDLYITSLISKLHGWQRRADELSETTKLFTVLGSYIKKYHGTYYYGKAINLTRRLTAAYDTVLNEYDLLLMPTMPMKATKLPTAEASREEYVARAIEQIGNTCPFNISHHPAMSIPCGIVEDLPIGLMLVGKHFDEATIYQAAYAFEQATDWKEM
ncbi:amidase [Nitrosomonas communis]|uniref:amidase n=1 Tax=Nitrosomonas communis TaxID=44574 RepID=UPI003D2B75A1